MYYTYVLLSKLDGKFYIGSTDDLKRRYKEHNEGKVMSTKFRRPMLLVYYEAYLFKSDANKQELFYKTGQGRRVLSKRLDKDKLVNL